MMFERIRKMKKIILGIVLILVVASAGPAFAESTGAEVSAIEAVKEELQTNINVVWTCVAAFLVFYAGWFCNG